MRSVAVAAVLVLFAAFIDGSAEPQTSPTFRAGTTLVDFTVVAVDARGNPVTDLQKHEMAILDDDESRDLVFFQFEGASGVSGIAAAPGSLPRGTFTNRTEYAPDAPRHLVAIVLDFVNASLVERFELRAQFVHYLKQIPPDAEVGLYVIRDNAVVIHDFTRHAGSLRARLENGELDVYARALANTGDVRKLLAGATPEQVESLAALAEANRRAAQEFNVQIARERRRKTLSALESVGDHLAGLRGRKSLVWVTHGFPLTNEREASYVEEVRETSRRLATRDIAVYPVDAGGLEVNRENPVAKGRVEGTAEFVASITGGRTTRNNNDLTLGLTAAAEDLRGTYSLGFYARDDFDSRWHRLTVKASRPGVILRHRQGYLSASTSPAVPMPGPQERWIDLAHRPLGSTAIRITARPIFDSGILRLALDVATEDLQFRTTGSGLTADVEIALVEKTASGPTNVRVQETSVQRSSGTALPAVALSTEFAVAPPTVSVRVIVRDKATGRFGSLDLTLEKLPRQ